MWSCECITLPTVPEVLAHSAHVCTDTQCYADWDDLLGGSLQAPARDALLGVALTGLMAGLALALSRRARQQGVHDHPADEDVDGVMRPCGDYKDAPQ